MTTEPAIENRPSMAPGGMFADRRRLVRLGLGLLLALFPVFFLPVTPYGPELVQGNTKSLVSLGTFAAVFAILAYGIGMLMRFLDLPSGGHGALFGIGAYGSALAIERLDFGFWPALLVAVVAASLVGVVMGALALRTTGLAFLIITIALGELIVLGMSNWDGLTEGPLGIFLTQTVELAPNVPLSDTWNRYYTALLFLGIAVLITWLVSRSTYGARLIAIRDNEPLARSLGLNTFAYKLSAFVISAALAGFAGHLYFVHIRAITPELFHGLALISVFLMVVMGGQGSLAGPAVGAWFVTWLPEWFEPVGLEDPTRQEMVFGVLLMAFMLAAPLGIVGYVSGALDRFLPRAIPPRRRRLTAETGSTDVEAPRTDEELLTLDNVAKSFHAVKAVDGVSLSVARGEIVGIIGPNGSGKTTLMNCASGFLDLTDGAVSWKGNPISGKRPETIARAGLLRTFQESMSFAEYSPREHCEVVWDLDAGRGGSRSMGSVDEVLEFLRLDEVADVPASDLPYGHISNLGLAAALSTRLPELIMLDEPAAGLSTAESAALRERLLELRDRGVTLVVVDHDMGFLMPMCDRMIVLDAGKKIAEGRPEEVRSNPDVIAAYLGEKFAERALARGGDG